MRARTIRLFATGAAVVVGCGAGIAAHGVAVSAAQPATRPWLAPTPSMWRYVGG